MLESLDQSENRLVHGGVHGGVCRGQWSYAFEDDIFTCTHSEYTRAKRLTITTRTSQQVEFFHSFDISESNGLSHENLV